MAQNTPEESTILELDRVRQAMRHLIQYLDRIVQKPVYTDFEDKIVDVKEGEAIFASNDLKNYRKKVEFYLKEHHDNVSVYKLRNNKKLNEADMKELERFLWSELGSRDDYIKEYGDTPVGRLVRKIVGVDRQAVNEAFSRFLSDEHLNVNQIRFINMIIDYIVANGNAENNAVLMEEPFRSLGSITVLFKDDLGKAKEIMSVVAEIKDNSEIMA
jgi:type I restriction enzyme R subunit